MVRRVVGRALSFERAVLRGYRRYQVLGADYPGVALDPDAATSGVLLRDVDGPALRRLDDYEGELYERRTVEVVLASGTNERAEVYIVPDAQRHRLSDRPWDPTRFAAAYRLRETGGA